MGISDSFPIQPRERRRSSNHLVVERSTQARDRAVRAIGNNIF
jgi:hypothetical protein